MLQQELRPRYDSVQTAGRAEVGHRTARCSGGTIRDDRALESHSWTSHDTRRFHWLGPLRFFDSLEEAQAYIEA